jgi:hypothetical protein
MPVREFGRSVTIPNQSVDVAKCDVARGDVFGVMFCGQWIARRSLDVASSAFATRKVAPRVPNRCNAALALSVALDGDESRECLPKLERRKDARGDPRR